MNGLLPWVDGETNGRRDVEAKVFQSRLLNLTLNWELTALALDARRYRAENAAERESLRDSATVYRKCMAGLSEVISRNCCMPAKHGTS